MPPPTPALNETPRKRAIRELADQLAPERERWIERNRFFHDEDLRHLRFLVPPGKTILDLGCGTGRLLAALEPARGVGVDFSPAMIDEARRRHPHLDFRVGDVEAEPTLADLPGPFDVVLLSDTIGSLEDCQTTLERLHACCHAETRIVVSYWSKAWEQVLRAAQLVGQQMPQVEQNWLPARDVANLLDLAGFQVVTVNRRMVVPKALGGLGGLVNRYVGTLPGVRAASLRTYVVARPRPAPTAAPSATIVVPCRNEAGNIEPAVQRIPRLTDEQEIVFVEGHSTDETLAEIDRVIAAYPELDIRVVRQNGVGKADAVRMGFDVARGDVLMILDADLTTPPEDLPKFYQAIKNGQGELVMGTRLVYPMQQDAMRFLNTAGNKTFSLLFTWLLDQRITDTLCGTKVLRRRHWHEIQANQRYFGDFDPFGDFDLIFGAAKLNLKILEIPVRYRARVYGTTQISRFRHGVLLARMVVIAHQKFKAQ